MKKYEKAFALILITSIVLIIFLPGCSEADISENVSVSADLDSDYVNASSETDGGDVLAPEEDADLAGENFLDPDTSEDEENSAETTEAGGNESDTYEEENGLEEETSDAEYLERIEELLEEAESTKASFQSRLSALEGAAANEYLALSEEERTEEKRSEIALKYYNEALALESECDTLIDSICAELQLLLIKTGGDRSVATTLRTEYNSEKEALKAEYMSVYGKYLT